MDMIAEILGKMNTIITIVSLVVAAIFLLLLIMAYEKIKSLERAKANLREENSALQDAIQKEWLKINRLLNIIESMKKIKRLEKNAEN